MISYTSAKEMAKKWNISQRRVAVLCAEGRIIGAMMVGHTWIIPENAQKPIDKRSVRYQTKKIEVKPFVKWAGGKGRLAKQLEKHVFLDEKRMVTRYVEPFVGGGALLFHMLSERNIESIYIGDTNAELINAYNVVKNAVEELIDKLAEMQLVFLSANGNERKNYYYAARDKFNALPLNTENATQKAALFIFLNKTCFNGLYRVNKHGQFNVPMGAYKNPIICDENNLRNASRVLQGVTIVCGDYSRSRDFIDKNTFVYLDPPYRPISKTAKFTAYNADGFDDDEQIRLAQFVEDMNLRGAKIIMSNSDPQSVNPEDTFFEDLYKGYKIERIEATRMINSKADCRGKITELLIYN